jgi:hypothetical protein
MQYVAADAVGSSDVDLHSAGPTGPVSPQDGIGWRVSLHRQRH